MNSLIIAQGEVPTINIAGGMTVIGDATVQYIQTRKWTYCLLFPFHCDAILSVQSRNVYTVAHKLRLPCTAVLFLEANCQ